MDNDYGKIVLYSGENGDLQLDVKLYENTVWLTQKQMVELFESSKANISEHIKNIFNECELEEKAVVRDFRTTAEDGKNYNVKYYNLDMIVALGYRIKSKTATKFRIWATKVLHQYLIDGYAINSKRLEALNKTVEIQSKMIADLAEIDAGDVLKVIKEYEQSFMLLDEYDHQNVVEPKLHKSKYVLDVNDCRSFIKEMDFYSKTGLFGTEKEEGKLEGILAAVNQTAFGQDVYPSLEEKAANLLYFLVKDHPFNDGCKRIAAALFLYFMDRNGALYRRNGAMLLSKSALVAMTLMIAESKPEEKNIIIKVVMNLFDDCSR